MITTRNMKRMAGMALLSGGPWRPGGRDGGGWGGGPGWGPPPPDYGYGGYGGYGGPPCVSGPLGLLQFCP